MKQVLKGQLDLLGHLDHLFCLISIFYRPPMDKTFVLWPLCIKIVINITSETNRDSTSITTTATIPYIKGTSEAIARILQPYNIRVAHKPITTLRHLLTNVKDKDEPNNRQGAIYKIECSDCQASYIGETGRNLNTQLTEHKRATRNGDVNNHISEHH